MKRLLKRTQGLIKGTSSAVLLSAAIHGGLLLIAGGFVVFTVILKEEKKFTPPPPVNRPKMELKKPKVKVKKKAKPKASQRIVSKSVQTMTDIQLPEISSMGEGLSGGIGGFELMPDPADMTLFGGTKSLSVGNDLEGTFYSLTLDRRGKRNGVGIGSENSYARILRKFFEAGWNPRSLAPYYRWPAKLYTSFIYVPLIGFEHVPRSFGIPYEVNTAMWIVHYKGKIAAPESGRYRFWGSGNFTLAVRVDGKDVAFLGLETMSKLVSDWRSSAEENMTFFTGKHDTYVGDWFELEAGEVVEMEVLIGDYNGADTMAALLVQQEGEFYNKAPDGAPILPVFKTAEIPAHLQDMIRYHSIESDQTLSHSLMFNVY